MAVLARRSTAGRHRRRVLLMAAIAGALTLGISAPRAAASSGGLVGESLTMATPGTSSSVSAWGENEDGQLGNGANTDVNVPVTVTGLSEATALSAGGYHSLALLSDGTVRAWGVNDDGELGNGSTESSNVPVAVKGLSEVAAVAAGDFFSLALLKDGTVRGWGENEEGELGNGSTMSSTAPVAVKGLGEVAAIAGGFFHSLASLKNGTVVAWGSNAYGQLGNGTETGQSDVPVAVKGLSEVTAVAGGFTHSLALLKNGTVMAWGNNAFGQLGDGTETNSDVPVAVKGLSEVTAIAAGSGHSLALLKNGTVVAWGRNVFGALGNGTEIDSDVPVAVTGLSEVTAIAAGFYYSLALLDNGAVMGWGSNGSGQLGDGTETNSDVPVTVKELSGATAIAAGAEHSLAAIGSPPPPPVVSRVEPPVGPVTGGTPVTITGTNLAGATAVKFGSRATTSFTVNSASSITAISPPWTSGNAIAEVSVTTRGGTSQLEIGDSFFYEPTVTKVEPSTGPAAGGTSVAITGAAFEGLFENGAAEAFPFVRSVKFGVANATSFTVGSDTKIFAVAPAGAGTVDATVETGGGTGPASAADTFTYGPTPAVTNVEVGEGHTTEGGSLVKITGANLNGATAVKFGSPNAAAFAVNSPTSVNAVSPEGTGTVDITVTTPEGTSATSPSDRFSYTEPFGCAPRPTITSVEPRIGPAGTTVRVKGEGLKFEVVCGDIGNSIGKVIFGAEEATIQGGEEYVAPQGTGTVDVRVEKTIHQTSPISPGDIFTYGTPPAPAVTKVDADHGPTAGGTTVTITGTNLAGATAVKFGLRNATSFKWNSETSVTATAPPWTSGDAVAEVTVTTPGGTSKESIGDSFIYEPTVTNIEPNTGLAAGGTSVAVTGTAFQGIFTNGSGERPPFVRAVKFGAVNARSFAVESETKLSAVAPAGAGLVDVTVETEGGKSPTSSADQFRYPAPSFPIVVTGAASSVTQTTATLNATVNPNEGEVKECEFEYGTTTGYGKSAPCTPSPGAGESPVAVSASISGLAARTTYHFRISATNMIGTSNGSDQIFTTLHNPNAGGHWYKNGMMAKEGARVPTIGWGTLALTSTAGVVTCHAVTAGYVENRMGGGPGVSATQSFDAYECGAAECPLEARLEAFKEPWRGELIAEKGTTRNETTGVEVVTGCWRAAPAGSGSAGTSERGSPVTAPLPFAGTLTPEIRNGITAGKPTHIQYGAGSGELENGPNGAGTTTGSVALLGYSEQELVTSGA